MAKNFQKSVFGLALGNMFLMVSLKAKLKACVGKYRMTLARFPRQKDSTPCSADTRVKQFAMPAQHSTLLVSAHVSSIDCDLLGSPLEAPAGPALLTDTISNPQKHGRHMLSDYQSIQWCTVGVHRSYGDQGAMLVTDCSFAGNF